MSSLTLKPSGSCRFDEISLGEIMLRLDPGDMRIRNARSFTVWEGGGEYNVARGLRNLQLRHPDERVLGDRAGRRHDHVPAMALVPADQCCHGGRGVHDG